MYFCIRFCLLFSNIWISGSITWFNSRKWIHNSPKTSMSSFKSHRAKRNTGIIIGISGDPWIFPTTAFGIVLFLLHGHSNLATCDLNVKRFQCVFTIFQRYHLFRYCIIEFFRFYSKGRNIISFSCFKGLITVQSCAIMISLVFTSPESVSTFASTIISNNSFLMGREILLPLISI